MEKYNSSNKDAEDHNHHIPEEYQIKSLNIPVSEVRDLVLQNVFNKQDKEVFQYLIDKNIIPTIVSSPDMRNNPHYDVEDKLISKVGGTDYYNTYCVPYDRSGRLYATLLEIHENGVDIRFGRSIEWINYQKCSTSNLKEYFYQS